MRGDVRNQAICRRQRIHHARLSKAAKQRIVGYMGGLGGCAPTPEDDARR